MRTRVVLITLIVCIATSAWAKPKVAIPPFEEDDDSAVRDGVADALDGDDFKVLGKRETKRAADKYDLTSISDKNAKKLASDLGANVLVLGSVGSKGGKTSLKIKLYVDGKKTKGFSISFSNPKSAKFKTSLHDAMVSKVDSAGGDGGGGDDGDSGDSGDGDGDGGTKSHGKGKHGGDDGGDGDSGDSGDGGDGGDDTGGKGKHGKGKHGGDDGDNGDDGDSGDDGGDGGDGGGHTKSHGKGKHGGDDGDDGDDGDGGSDDSGKGKHGKGKSRKHHNDNCDDGDDSENCEDKGGDDEPTTPLHSPNRAAIRVDLGIQASNRIFNLTSRANFPEGPKDYRNSVVPGAHLAAEIYPLAFSNPKSPASGLGIAVDYEKTLKLNVASSAEPTTKLAVNQQRLTFGARFRIVIGDKPTAPSITLGLDYGRRKFIISRTALMDPNSLRIPDTDYHFIGPGLSFRVPFIAAVALVGGGDAMLVSNAGPVQLASQYGRAKVVGVEAFGGLDFSFTSKVGFRVTAEYAQIGFTFVGPGGEIVNNLDNDPASKDIGGALDRSIGVSGTLAVMY